MLTGFPLWKWGVIEMSKIMSPHPSLHGPSTDLLDCLLETSNQTRLEEDERGADQMLVHDNL
jgi:hypothetical protein